MKTKFYLLLFMLFSFIASAQVKPAAYDRLIIKNAPEQSSTPNVRYATQDPTTKEIGFVTSVPGATPTLQQVTTTGNTTDKRIIVRDDTNEKFIAVARGSNDIAIYPNRISHTSNGEYGTQLIFEDSEVTNQSITIPHNSGIMALISDIPTTADQLGALAIDGSNATTTVDLGANGLRSNYLRANGNGDGNDIYITHGGMLGDESGMYSSYSDEIIAAYDPAPNKYFYGNGKLQIDNNIGITKIDGLFQVQKGFNDGVEDFFSFDNFSTGFNFVGKSGTAIDNFGSFLFGINPEECLFSYQYNNSGNVVSSIIQNPYSIITSISDSDVSRSMQITQTEKEFKIVDPSTANPLMRVAREFIYLDAESYYFNTPTYADGLMSIYGINGLVNIGDWNGNMNSTFIAVNDIDRKIVFNTNDVNIKIGTGAMSIGNGSLRLAQRSTTEISSMTPTEGDTYYNSTLKTIVFYNGTSWQKVTTTPM